LGKRTTSQRQSKTQAILATKALIKSERNFEGGRSVQTEEQAA
jgi:hypothetical protein